MGGVKIAAGVAVGMFLMPVLVRIMPKDEAGIPRFRRFYGLFHIVIGAATAQTIRQPAVREVALVVAGIGVYDLIASNLTFLGLPVLPSWTPVRMGQDSGVIGTSRRYAPALGASYQERVAASYEQIGQDDDVAYGGDSDLDLE